MPGISIQLDETNVTICIALPRIWFMAGVPVPVPVHNERQKKTEKNHGICHLREIEKKTWQMTSSLSLHFSIFFSVKIPPFQTEWRSV